MKDNQPIVPWMEHLSQLIPPSGVVYVGAGQGGGDWVRFLSVLDDIPVILVEADPISFKFLESMATGHAGWQIRNEVITQEVANVSFHQTTVSSENSLICTDHLLGIWPNLKLQQVLSLQSLTLEKLLDETPLLFNWLLIDCLPALPIIEGLGDGLDAVDVIAARVIVSNVESALEVATLQSLQDSLGTHGFRLQAVEISRHPSLAHALFIRSDCFGYKDIRQQMAGAEEKVASLSQQLATAEGRIPSLDPQLAAADQVIAERDQRIAGLMLQVEQLTQANATANQRVLELQQIKAVADLKHIVVTGLQNPNGAYHEINQATLEIYSAIESTTPTPTVPDFLLIDSKSIPRSGLHHLKNTLAKLLGDHFSFCEWYSEVGCCKQYPCALTAYAAHARKSGDFRVRLVKSHDLEGKDPMIPPGLGIQRLILVRAPLFTLTSWFELEELRKYNQILLKHGIDIRKIWLKHEKEILNSAYGILESCYVEPPTEEFTSWLAESTRYMIQFINRWVKPALDHSDPGVRLISYEGIDQYVLDVTKPYLPTLSETARKTLEKLSQGRDVQFKKRSDPFSARARPIEAYLRKNACLFESAANLVLERTQINQSVFLTGKLIQQAPPEHENKPSNPIR
jgi:hypothetical protein